jgi:hypothetical protein
MMSRIVRSIGIVTLLLALIALNRDINKTLDDAALHVTKLGDLWYAVHPTSLQLLQPAIERHVAEWLWDPVILSVLTAPACLDFGVLGAILMLLGRKKKRPMADAR